LIIAIDTVSYLNLIGDEGDMANIFTLVVLPEGKKQVKALKNFDATENPELNIASALFEGCHRTKGKGVVAITSCNNHSNFYYVIENMTFKDNEYYDKKLRGIDVDAINNYFNAFKEGRQKPIKLPEAYSFIKSNPDTPITKELDLSDLKVNYDFTIFPNFIHSIFENPNDYDKKVVEICKTAYNNYPEPSLYGTRYLEDMVRYPDWLKPTSVETSRLDLTTWKITGDIDGQHIIYTVKYDSKGILNYGSVGIIELAGKLVEEYILYKLKDAYLDYTQNSIDYKISQITGTISRYLDDARGEDFRQNYDKTSGFMKNPDDFVIDMEMLVQYSRDDRLTKKEIYEVIDHFKNNPETFRKYADNSNSHMDLFYPWFEGRVSKGKKLFKNVPKE